MTEPAEERSPARPSAPARPADAAWRRAIMTALQDPLFISTPDGLVLEVNAAFTRFLGWSLADGPLRPPYPWWPDEELYPEAFERIRAAHESLSITEPRVGEFQLRDKDGAIRWAAHWAVVVNDPENGQTAVLKTLRDVTREHASRDRRAEAARIAAGFAAATDLDELVGIAVHGFAVLFEGTAILQLLDGGEPDVLFTVDGAVEADSVPAEVRARMADSTDPGLGRSVVSEGILLWAGAGQSLCRAWVGFASPRSVSTDELIVGDMMIRWLDLALRRIEEAVSFALREEHLSRAIESHRFVGQAIGILVERHRLTAGAAFERLRTASQNKNLKLRDVAERVITTGEEP